MEFKALILGILESGCTLSAISNCYYLSLSNNSAEQLDTNDLDSPRQRDEFHFPLVSGATEFSYTWKQYLYASIGTSSTWFHIMQTFGEVENSPLVTLDVVSDTLRIKDHVRGTGGKSCCTVACPFIVRSPLRTLSRIFGPGGGLSYNVTNDVGDNILTYGAVHLVTTTL
ncbi:hypothetical protein B0H13DRAFT_1610124 [Mycena leptocephala]|nr:hypothetical protein B0H13DRAFT_1610124 [Mycena leptocephala]